jgi:hypothetical protein
MALKWYLTVERGQDVLFVDDALGSAEYLRYLFAIARLVDEKLPGGFIRVLTPGSKGVIGLMVEWEKEPGMLLFEGQQIKDLADAARAAGINYGERSQELGKG